MDSNLQYINCGNGVTTILKLNNWRIFKGGSQYEACGFYIQWRKTKGTSWSHSETGKASMNTEVIARLDTLEGAVILLAEKLKEAK